MIYRLSEVKIKGGIMLWMEKSYPVRGIYMTHTYVSASKFCSHLNFT